jgi:ribosomal protein L16 Arg81 hydroxylase
MDFIGQKILSETDLLKNDNPHFFKSFISNFNSIASWADIESCLNRPEIFNFELIDKDSNMKIDIPQANKTWVWDHPVQDKGFLFDKINHGHGLVIMNYASYSETTNKLVQTFEKLFDVNAALHVYCGLEGAGSFPIHDDYPVNFIIQIEGKTRWKVFHNRISNLYQIGTLNSRRYDKQIDETDLEVALDVELEPGDALYIPSRCYHVAYPTAKRISVSIPCWIKYPSDPLNKSSDRNWYSIRKS